MQGQGSGHGHPGALRQDTTAPLNMGHAISALLSPNLRMRMENKRSPTACMENTPHHSRTWSAWWLRAALVSTPHCSQVWGSPGTSASRMHSPSRASPRAKAEHLPRAMHQEQGRRQARSTEQGCFAPQHEDISICSHPAPTVSPSRSCPVPRCPHGPARWRG